MDKNPIPPLEIPPSSLSSEALSAVIEAFVLREGTDYGTQEVDLATKMEQVRRQLSQGQVKMIFDPNTESINLITSRDWGKLK